MQISFRNFIQQRLRTLTCCNEHRVPLNHEFEFGELTKGLKRMIEAEVDEDHGPIAEPGQGAERVRPLDQLREDVARSGGAPAEAD